MSKFSKSQIKLMRMRNFIENKFVNRKLEKRGGGPCHKRPVAKTIRILYKQQYYIQYDFGAVQTV
jgi:hypothetical protein